MEESNAVTDFLNSVESLQFPSHDLNLGMSAQTALQGVVDALLEHGLPPGASMTDSSRDDVGEPQMPLPPSPPDRSDFAIQTGVQVIVAGRPSVANRDPRRMETKAKCKTVAAPSSAVKRPSDGAIPPPAAKPRPTTARDVPWRARAADVPPPPPAHAADVPPPPPRAPTPASSSAATPASTADSVLPWGHDFPQEWQWVRSAGDRQQKIKKSGGVNKHYYAALGRMQGKGAAAMAEFHKHVKRPESKGGGTKFHEAGCRAGYKGAVCTCKGGNKGGDKGGNKGGDRSRDGKASKGKKGQPAREPWRSDASSAAMRHAPDASGT